MKDFITSESPLLGDEQIVGVVEAKIPLTEDDFTLFNKGRRKLCPNCSKGFHNQYEEDEVCKKHGCKCLCQQYYLGRNGKSLIEWGYEDTSDVEDINDKREPNPILDNFIRIINNQHSKLKDLGIIFAHKICTRCGISGRFEGWACKPCKIELSEKDQIILEKN